MKFFLFPILIGFISVFPQSRDAESPVDANIGNIIRHLEFLGSDLFEGRGTGTVGGNLAARYIALEFDRMKLNPIGTNNTYYQYIPMHGSYPSEESELIVFNEGKAERLILWDDYLLYKSGEQTFIPTPVPLVFAGYGIVAPEYDYNDYQSLDVEGKIVVMLDGEPISESSDFFAGEYPTVYGFHESKMRTALSRGAAGSIIIPMHFSDEEGEWRKKRSEYEFEDINLAYSVSGNFGILIRPAKAGILFSGAKFSLEEIFDKHHENKTESMPLETELSFKGKFKRRDFVASNIIGLMEGSDENLKDSFLILSAHYDHLGIGPAVGKDSIYNGVLDNALGVSVVLELARQFTSLNPKPRRSIVFLLTTGEEEGLLGSTYYTDHPVVPLYKSIANVNIDGVPVFDEFNSIVGIGAELSTLNDFLKASAGKAGLAINNIPIQYVMTEAFNRSDQIAFAKAGIPSILILEGLDYVNIPKEEAIAKHLEYQSRIYHTPFDDLNQNINYDAVDQYTGFIFEFCFDLLNSEESPEWISGSPYYNARLRSIAEKR